MHIYIQLTAEGYQRSFPAIWGWHWYRSYLMSKEQRPEPQIVTWVPSFCWGFGPCFCADTRWGIVLLVLGAQRFLTCLHPLHSCERRFYQSGRNCSVCVCSYQAIFVSVLLLRITGICAHILSVLFEWVHQVILKRDIFEKFRKNFVNTVSAEFNLKQRRAFEFFVDFIAPCGLKQHERLTNSWRKYTVQCFCKQGKERRYFLFFFFKHSCRMFSDEWWQQC